MYKALFKILNPLEMALVIERREINYGMIHMNKYYAVIN